MTSILENNNNLPTMSSMNDPKSASAPPSSMKLMIEKMKKRQLEIKDSEQVSKKVAYTGNKRLDLNATVIASRNTEKSERFTVVLSTHGLKSLHQDSKTNGYYDAETQSIQIKPKDSEDHITLIPGQVLELSRYHGGKPEKVPKTFHYGDCVVLKRVSATPGNRGDGTMFFNVHWVEASPDSWDLTMPESMTNVQSDDSYYKTVSFPVKDENAQVQVQPLRITGNDKFYSRVSSSAIDAMLWQEKIFELGIWNPEVLDKALPMAFEKTTITLFGNKEKPDEQYQPNEEDAPVRFNVRKMILGENGSLDEYLKEFATPVEKKTVIKELGKSTTSDLSDGHPLNSVPNTKVLNLNEWTGSIKEIPANATYYKLFDLVIYAVLA